MTVALGKIAYYKAVLLDEDPSAHLKEAIEHLNLFLPKDHPYLIKVQTSYIFYLSEKHDHVRIVNSY
jgi:hypothetical protein